MRDRLALGRQRDVVVVIETGARPSSLVIPSAVATDTLPLPMASATARERASVALVHFTLFVPLMMSSLQILRRFLSAAAIVSSARSASRTLLSRICHGMLALVGERGGFSDTSSGLTETQLPFHRMTSNPPLPTITPEPFAP